MDTVVRDLEGRLTEVEVFLSFLKQLERSPRSASTGIASTNAVSSTLKACAFLLIYNVVESCVRSSFAESYAKALDEGLGFAESTDKFRDVWLRQQLDVPTNSAIHQTYLNEASRIAIAASVGTPLELSARKLPVSGNLTADKIRALCSKHGVRLVVSRWAKGGIELDTVKEQRNALSHGHKSFAECGRDYTAKDLERIFKQTRHYMRGFVRSVASFNENCEYRR